MSWSSCDFRGRCREGRRLGADDEREGEVGLPEVAKKRANKAASAAAELVKFDTGAYRARPSRRSHTRMRAAPATRPPGSASGSGPRGLPQGALRIRSTSSRRHLARRTSSDRRMLEPRGSRTSPVYRGLERSGSQSRRSPGAPVHSINKRHRATLAPKSIVTRSRR